MSESKRQFGTLHLLGTITAIAISFGLLSAAINMSSDRLFVAAIVALGLSIGGPIGFMVGGKNGARLGGAIGVGLLLIAYAMLPTAQ